MDEKRRIEWNLGDGTRTRSASRAGRRRGDRAPGEVQVHFSDALNREENLHEVLAILRDLHEFTFGAVLIAVKKVFLDAEGLTGKTS